MMTVYLATQKACLIKSSVLEGKTVMSTGHRDFHYNTKSHRHTHIPRYVRSHCSVGRSFRCLYER